MTEFLLALAQQPTIEVDIVEGSQAWWTNPMWIAIGIVGLVMLVLIVALAARGGGTTVIKE